MKEIEELLQTTRKAEPRRQLGSDFVQRVLYDIKDSAPAPVARKGNLFMKLTRKPLFAALAIGIVLATGTTAYAAVINWPTVQALFGGEHVLDSGARIVEVNTEGCEFEKPTPNGKDVRYYEIRKDSKFTNQQVVDMLRGVCEEDRANRQTTKMVQAITPHANGSVVSRSFFTVEQVQDSSITVVLNTKYRTDAQGNDRKTYRVAKDVQVADGSTAIKYTDLKPGDTVVLVTVDERNISTEKQGYVEDLSKIEVKGILKTPAFTGDPMSFYSNLGKEFVRVEPSKDGNGFVRVYEFQQ